MIVSWIIAFIIIFILLIVTIYIYYQFFHPITASSDSSPSGTMMLASNESPINQKSASFQCLSDLQCPPGQTCLNGACTPLNQSCGTDLDCPMGLSCQDGTCQTHSCMTYTDCPNKQACIHPTDDRIGICSVVGNICQNNNECKAGTPYCINNQCKQCRSDNECIIGEYCSDGICKSPCRHDNDCDDNHICITELGHVCPKSYRHLKNIRCGDHSDCGPDGYCNAGICTCVPMVGKQLFEVCKDDRDCLSQNCKQLNYNSKVCSYPSGNCIYNHDPNIADPFSNHCPADRPFCILGQCSQRMNGSPCSTTAMCQNDGNSLFCVNNICSPIAGQLGDHCGDNDACLSKYCTFDPQVGANICADPPRLSGPVPVGVVQQRSRRNQGRPVGYA